ncbi:MAG: diguanylate cyclase [Chloroflexota bacterium]
MNNQMQLVEKEKVLVVDDMPQNIQVLTDLLRLKGYSVQTTCDPREAFRLALSHPPDLIVLDIMMPEMTGYELCRKLKARQETQHIPVIFVSALGQQPDILEAFSSGGVDYITKPFRVKEVSTRIRNHLAIRRLQTKLEAKNHELQDQNEALKHEIAKRKEAETALTVANRRLQTLATTDPVTGIDNRLSFEAFLEKVWLENEVQQRPVGLLMCDVDRFKQINDVYGHPFGDHCLRVFAQTLAEVTPPAGLTARYGGDEFVVVLPNAEVDTLQQVAGRFEFALANRPLTPPYTADTVSLTASIGTVSMLPAHQEPPHRLVDEADRALYTHKKKKRLQTED